MFNLEEYLKERNFEIKYNEPLKTYSTMRVGAEADLVIFPKDSDEFVEMVTIFEMNNYNYYVIGNGSNVIFTDKGFKGAIISTKKIKGISLKNNILTVKCGTILREVSSFCLKNELSGFENLSGIPGTLGGAVFMNAGAYGSEIKDIIISAKVLDKNGNVYTIYKKDMSLQYRHTNFMDNNLFVLEASFMLKKSNYDDISKVISENDKLRISKQPVNERSVGSTFKRPDGHFAGKLIEDAGLKGYSIGGASVSTVHAGFIVNSNNATATEVLELIDFVTKTVFEKFGVKLELEAVVV